MTPAKAVERFRLEMARAALERSGASLEQIAESTGFGNPGRMRRAFLRTSALPPQTLRGAARRALQCGNQMNQARDHSAKVRRL